jgi:hypothetical protein
MQFKVSVINHFDAANISIQVQAIVFEPFPSYSDLLGAKSGPAAIRGCQI